MDPCNRVSPGNRAVRVYLRSIVNPAMGNGGYNAWIRPMALIWETVRTIMAICFIFSTLFINSFPSIEIIPQDMSLSEPPCSHFETVCRTTFSLTASACCDSPFDFLIAFRFSQSTKTSFFFVASIIVHKYCRLAKHSGRRIHPEKTSQAVSWGSGWSGSMDSGLRSKAVQGVKPAAGIKALLCADLDGCGTAGSSRSGIPLCHPGAP